MRLEFRAVDGGFDNEDDPIANCLVCGFSGRDAIGGEHYLHFQRGFENEDPAEDWGVYCEFDSQINSAYNCVRRCRLARMTLDVDFLRPIDWQKKYTGLSVDVSGLSETTLTAIRSGLPRIFRGTEGVLELA